MRLIIAVATLTIVVVLFAGITCASEAESGDEPYDVLASESPYSRYVGEGYILGVMDATHSLAIVCRLPVRWTRPPDTTNGKILGAVKNYLDQHLEERYKKSYLLVINALENAFPPKN